MTFQYLDRVLFDDDIRIHSVSLDDPTAVFIRSTELWHKYGATVEQRPVIGDADRSTPCALADQGADFPLAKRIRENVSVRRRVFIDQSHLRSRLHDPRIGIRRLMIARKAGAVERTPQPFDQQ